MSIKMLLLTKSSAAISIIVYGLVESIISTLNLETCECANQVHFTTAFFMY